MGIANENAVIATPPPALYGTADGLPVGVQLVAGFGREDVLVRIAAQLDAAQQRASRRPPVSA
ncbi:MAG: hypothetical protein ABI894_10470 [Ilumatobacteraceae bacterium]